MQDKLIDPFFIDSHCHFDFSVFNSERKQIWQRCEAQGLKALLIPGVHPEQWRDAQACVDDFPTMYFSVGLHPWYLDKIGVGEEDSEHTFWSSYQEQLKRYLHHPQCVAIGECGLDKSISAPMPLQQQVLEAHLQWCIDWNKPLILHCVKAHAELLALLKKYPLAKGGVIHAFSGSIDIAREYHKLGFCLGAGGTITYERARKTRHAFSEIPASAILLETDAPDMPIAGRQGEPNSPEYLLEIAKVLAELRSETMSEIGRYTSKNFQRLFLS